MYGKSETMFSLGHLRDFHIREKDGMDAVKGTAQKRDRSGARNVASGCTQSNETVTTSRYNLTDGLSHEGRERK